MSSGKEQIRFNFFVILPAVNDVDVFDALSEQHEADSLASELSDFFFFKYGVIQ